jgi:C1A family cysteine protease
LVIRNQLNQNACTGYATSALRYFYLKDKKLLSPLFVYYLGRAKIHEESEDKGARISDVVEVLVDVGICEESYHPDIPDTNKDVFIPPMAAAYLNAKNYKVNSVVYLNSLNDLLLHLASGHVAVLGFVVFEEFEETGVTASGMVPIPTQSSITLGGHAVCACGYSLKSKYIKFANSYGLNWGNQGFGYLPFDYFPDYIISCIGVKVNE